MVVGPAGTASGEGADPERDRPSPRTILLVHNYYRYRGGEDVVVEAETKLLERHGHRVYHLTTKNEEIHENGPVRDRIRLAVQTVWSWTLRDQITQLVQRVRPDVAHFHNTFPLISPSVYAACGNEGVAVVQTLHNYRMLCPAATLLRNQRPCEACLGKTVPWRGVVHACYRESRVQTGVVSTMLAVHNTIGTWTRDVDLYLALTEFGRDTHIRGGLPPERVVVKTNFVEPDPGVGAGPRDHFLFASRLDESKGFDTLLKAWSILPQPASVLIVSDGPLVHRLAEYAADSRIRFLGRIERSEMFRLLRSARALIFPSIWYEGLGNLNIESFACGTPVIASRLGAMQEVIRDRETGLLFTPGDHDDLARTVAWATEHGDELQQMGLRARREFESKYTPDRVYDSLIAAYATARRLRDAKRRA
jgi:glycosyltransferase involved in cell wall biosynthesis